MDHKNPVVVSADGKKHETLGDGDTIAPRSIPISAESGNGLSIKYDGLFSIAAAGGSGIESVSHNNSLSGNGTTESQLTVKISNRDGNAIKFLDLVTSEGGLFADRGGKELPGFVSKASNEKKDINDISDQYDAMIFDAPVTVPTQWHYLATLDSGEPIGSARDAVYLTAVPMGDGQVISWDGLSPQGATYGNYIWQHERRYVDGSGDSIILASQTDPIVIRHDESLYGEGSTASLLEVKLSEDGGNSLSLKNDGLFVPPTQTMKHGTSNGNFSFEYPDNKSANSACGKMGTGAYWKITIPLDNAGVGNVAAVPRVWTKKIPCMEDGTLVPYQFVVDYIESLNNATPTVAVWFICMGVPTHLMDVTSGELKKLQRNSNGLTNGLDDLYPIAPDVEDTLEPQWNCEYFYTA